MTEQQTITRFYEGFKKLDASEMIACYHEDVVFSDPAFGELKGEKAKAMWQMLCSNAKDFKLTYSDVKGSDEVGSAKWEAHYIFSKTGNAVHNIIQAKFKFSDGKIIEHRDDFNLHKWASQAMGWKGRILGGTGFFKNQLNKTTAGMLKKWMAKEQ